MIKLYLDEDVPEAIAIALRLRGYDVLTVKDASRKGLADSDQLRYASSTKRVIYTHNTEDFCKIHANFIKTRREHQGIIVSKQLPIGILIKALLNLLADIRSENIENRIIWLSDWIKK